MANSSTLLSAVFFQNPHSCPGTHISQLLRRISFRRLRLFIWVFTFSRFPRFLEVTNRTSPRQMRSHEFQFNFPSQYIILRQPLPPPPPPTIRRTCRIHLCIPANIYIYEYVCVLTVALTRGGWGLV